MDQNDQQAIENRIAGIYRTYFENFGPSRVPESVELNQLWSAWEAIEAEATNGD